MKEEDYRCPTLPYVVEAVGFEPTTLWLKARYSSQLSYASVFGIAYGNRTRLATLKG